MYIFLRDCHQIICSCGGTVAPDVTTIEEEAEYGCGTAGCCVKALKCQECEVRFMLDCEAPEMDTF